MKQFLFATDNDWAGLVLRLTVGLILFPHGAQKLLGWFGGPGISGIMEWLTQVVKLPWIVAAAVVLIEFAGALAIIAGVGTRFWAVAVIGLMVGIVLTSHLQNGFFMNWEGSKSGEGYEYHLLMIGLSLGLLILGGGRYSVDRLLMD
ncbi:MAG: DoxX family protein [Ignavibacterium sp.]